MTSLPNPDARNRAASLRSPLGKVGRAVSHSSPPSLRDHPGPDNFGQIVQRPASNAHHRRPFILLLAAIFDGSQLSSMSLGDTKDESVGGLELGGVDLPEAGGLMVADVAEFAQERAGICILKD